MARIDVMKKEESGVVKNKDYIYVGLFMEADALQKACGVIKRTPLEKGIADPHITFAFRPKEIDMSLFGEKALVTVVGYGCSEENEGLQVTLASGSKSLRKEFDKIAVPHITLSIASDGKAVNTKDVEFRAIEPFTVEMTFGGFRY